MIRRLTFNDSKKYPFCLDKVLYAGQDFRWQPWGGNWHSGVLAGNLIHIRQVGDVLEYKSHLNSDLDEMLTSYFRLCDPIDEIYDEISCRDTTVAELVKKYPWLRVLRQPDPWECMSAYICSANNNVPRISAIVESIARDLGERIELCGDVRYTVPSPEKVLDAGVERLEKLRLGLDRHSKIFAAAKRISDGQLDLYNLAQSDVPHGETIRELKESHGVGDKIADCIALFSLNKTMAFPVDVWVRRAVEDCSEPPPSSTYKTIAKWAQGRFEKHAGFANQFLFLGKWLADNPNSVKPHGGRDRDVEDAVGRGKRPPSTSSQTFLHRLVSFIRRRRRR